MDAERKKWAIKEEAAQVVVPGVVTLIMDFGSQHLAIVDPTPAKAVALTVSTVMQQQRRSLLAGHALPQIPADFLVASTETEPQDARPTPASGAALQFAVDQWDGCDDIADEVPSSQHDGGGSHIDPVVQQTTLKTVTVLLSTRTGILNDLQLAGKQLLPRQWANAVIPRIETYLRLLQYLADHDGRSAAYFYWAPGKTAIPDVHYEAASICGLVAACEKHAASLLVTRASDGVAAAGHLAARQQAMQTADEERRLAYKFLCSAAARYAEASRTMRNQVEPGLIRAAAVDATDAISDANVDIHPLLSSQYYSAMEALALAEAQEIGFHRGVLGSQKDDSLNQSASHPRTTDSLAASLAARCVELYSHTVSSLKLVPAPGSPHSVAAAAALFVVLEAAAAARASLWTSIAHALAARQSYASSWKVALAHCAKARTGDDGTTAALSNLERMTRNDTKSLANMSLNRVCEGISSGRRYALEIIDAVERMNSLVAHESADADAISQAVLPIAKELARAKPFSL
jgi:hypothetical protein